MLETVRPVGLPTTLAAHPASSGCELGAWARLVELKRWGRDFSHQSCYFAVVVVVLRNSSSSSSSGGSYT